MPVYAIVIGYGRCLRQEMICRLVWVRAVWLQWAGGAASADPVSDDDDLSQLVDKHDRGEPEQPGDRDRDEHTDESNGQSNVLRHDVAGMSGVSECLGQVT